MRTETIRDFTLSRKLMYFLRNISGPVANINGRPQIHAEWIIGISLISVNSFKLDLLQSNLAWLEA